MSFFYSANMNILIYEPSLKGHHLNYLKIILKTFNTKNNTLTLLTIKNPTNTFCLKEVDKTQINILQAKINNLLTKLYYGPKLYYKEIVNFFVLVKHFRRHGHCYDLVFFPYIDCIARILSILPDKLVKNNWSGISMAPNFHLHEMGLINAKSNFVRLEKLLFIRLLKKTRLTKIFTIDLTLKNYVDITFPEYSHKLEYLADPVTVKKSSHINARHYFGIEGKTRVLLLFGHISERKGVFELIDLIKRDKLPSDLLVIIAGVQENTITKKLYEETKNLSNKIFVINRYLSDQEQSMIFRISDIVWCVYKNFYGMSSVLAHATSYGKPVIANNQGVIAWIVKKYLLGEIVSIEDENEMSAAIQEILGSQTLYSKYSLNAKKFSFTHTEEQFTKTIVNSLNL